MARKKGIKAGAWRGKDGLHSKARRIPGKRGGASEKNLRRRCRRKHERVREKSAEAFQEDLKSLDFSPSLAQPEIGKGIGREGPVHKKTGQNESE